jgi:DNA-binding NarL/FixJ family response regulator
MTHVLIVDDQAIVRRGLGVILQHQSGIEVVGYAADDQEALDQVAATAPDVVLMDLKMPRLNGIQATERIVEQVPAAKVVVLTTYDSEEWVFDAIRAGASGYLLKDSDSQDVVAAVQGAADGEVRLDPSIAGKVLQEFNRLKGLARPPGLPGRGTNELPPLEELTARELSILQEMAQGKSNREIVTTLFLAEGTVKNYVSIIISKLQANDRTQAAIMALKRGLATLE